MKLHDRIKDIFIWLRNCRGLVVGLFGLAIFLAALLLLVSALDLIPPSSIRMAAGKPGSAYHSIAEKYRAILAEDGIELEILESAGSVENAALLALGGADVAILQGGINVPPVRDVEALAAIFLEPLLIFHDASRPEAADISKWTDLRVAAGEPGSGTRAVLTSIMETLGAGMNPSQLEPLGGMDAARALIDGKIDVAAFVAPVDAAYLDALFRDESIAIAQLRDVAAPARRLDYVRHVNLPPSTIDYAAHIPRTNIELNAMIAKLVATADLHPALINRLVRAAERIHRGPVLLSDNIRFPMIDGVDMPVNAQAEAMFRSGRSVLDRNLPYWISAQVSRIAVLILPLLIVAMPLVRLLPAVYDWYMSWRVLRAYNRLQSVEAAASSTAVREEREALLQHLDDIEDRLKSVDVPLRYKELVYTVRQHIELVRQRIDD